LEEEEEMKKEKVVYLIPFKRRLKNPESLDEIYAQLEILRASKSAIYYPTGPYSWEHNNANYIRSTPLCLVRYQAQHKWYVKVPDGYTVATTSADIEKSQRQRRPKTTRYIVVSEEIKKYERIDQPLRPPAGFHQANLRTDGH
jgi:hypothetical protein